MYQNAANMYQNNAINTASPAELTLMLYEGAIKFCNLALHAMENNNYEGINTNIIKAEKIISEFRASLNKAYPVASDFDKIYEYIYYLLVQANIKKDRNLLEKALGEIRDMRDTWKEVMRLNRAVKG